MKLDTLLNQILEARKEMLINMVTPKYLYLSMKSYSTIMKYFTIKDIYDECDWLLITTKLFGMKIIVKDLDENYNFIVSEKCLNE